MDDLLLPAYQKLYAALQSLERFSKGQDLFENIASIDSFLSEFRGTGGRVPVSQKCKTRILNS